MFLEALRSAWRDVRGGPRLPVRERAPFRSLVLVVVGGALIVRALLAFDGLPYLHAWDEPFVVSKALDMMKKGTLDPDYFIYGTLPTYMSMGVSIAHYLWLMGRPESTPPSLGHLDQITTYYDTGWLWDISHPSFYLWSRWLASVLGAGTVLLAYLIGRRLAGRWAGLLAALLLAGQAFHAQQSAIATVDNPMTFFVMLAAWGAVVFVESRHAGHLILSLSACGLAASCKYTAAPSVIMPLLAVAFTSSALPPARRRLAWLGIPVVPFLAFLAGSPYALLNLRAFLIDVGKAVKVYEATPWAQSAINPGLEHLSLQTGRIFAKLGPIPALLVLVGLLLLATKRAGFVVVAYGAVHTLFMSSSRLSYPRNFLVLYPIMAVGFGAGVILVMRVLGGLSPRMGRAGRHVRLAAGVLIALLPLTAGFTTARAAFQIGTREESRTVAARRLSEIAARAESPLLAIPAELKMHSQDLARLGAPFEEAPFLDLLCGGRPYTHAVVPARWSSYARKRRWLPDLLNRLEPGGVVERERGRGRDPLSIDSPSIHPIVEILTLDHEAALSESSCLGLYPAKDLLASEPWKVNANGEVPMIHSGWVRTEWVLAAPGPHAIVVEGRGSAAAGEPAKVWVRALGRFEGEEPVTLGEEVLDLPRKLERHALVFDAPEEGVLAADVEFFNDYYDAATKSDRNAYVTRIYLLRLEEREASEE